MTSDEHRIAYAITTVARQLTARGAPEPLAIATDLVNNLLRDGWRPRAPRAVEPVFAGEVTYQPTEDYRDARRAMGCGGEESKL